ncbi:MAG: polymer-forming cytoskeletal protein [Anaerolineae bacterium]|nr:polymer-forming cytoskeletal protein [Anaerolineae bacterium]
MNKIARIFVVLTLLCTAMLAFPSVVSAQSGDGNDQLVLGDSFTLETGQVQSGSLVVVGGTVTIKEGARVLGDIFVTGGSLDLRGKVDGSVTSLGSLVDISDTAVIGGDLSTVGGTLDRAEKSVVKGHVDVNPGNRFSVARPDNYLKMMPQAPFIFDMGPVKDVFGAIARALGMAALAALVTLFLFKPTENVAAAAINQPVMSFFMGLLTFVVAPALMVVLIITLILSPLGLLGLLIMGLAIIFGWIALGYEVGHRLASSLKVDWAAPVIAGVGVLALSLISEMGAFVPCIGWIIPAFISLLGLGSVVISRFGSLPQNGGMAPAMPVPPAAYPPMKIAHEEVKPEEPGQEPPESMV